MHPACILLRMRLIKLKILKTNLPIDIFGRGCAFYLHSQHPSHSDRRIRGRFQTDEPYKEYQYTIAIENFTSVAYVSEKCVNPLLCGTKVVYFGASNVNQIFASVQQEIVLLTGNLSQDIQYIRSLYYLWSNPILTASSLLSDPRSTEQENIAKVKHRVNILNHLPALFDLSK
jgi:hypothetical protein